MENFKVVCCYVLPLLQSLQFNQKTFVWTRFGLLLLLTYCISITNVVTKRSDNGVVTKRSDFLRTQHHKPVLISQNHDALASDAKFYFLARTKRSSINP